TLHGHGQIFAEQARKRPHLGRQAERLQLAAAIILEGGLQHPCHFKCRGGNARNGQQGGCVNLDDFIHAIGDDHVARGGPAIAGHQHALREPERKNGRRLRLNRGGRRGYGGQRRQLVGGQQREKVPRNWRLRVHWPVRWRYLLAWSGSTLRIRLRSSSVLGFSTLGEPGPSPPPLGPGPTGRVFCAWSGIKLTNNYDIDFNVRKSSGERAPSTTLAYREMSSGANKSISEIFIRPSVPRSVIWSHWAESTAAANFCTHFPRTLARVVDGGSHIAQRTAVSSGTPIICPLCSRA